MKSIIICLSVHHQNTFKIARKIAEVLNCEIKKPSEIPPQDLKNYNLVGFGSGIYFSKHHKEVLNFAQKLPDMQQKSVFIFSTSGVKNGIRYHKALRQILEKKGCQILGEFNCLGWDTFALLKLIGGINKGRPNKNDFKQASDFARKLKREFYKKNENVF